MPELTSTEWREVAKDYLRYQLISTELQNKIDLINCGYLPEYSEETLRRAATDIIEKGVWR